MVVMSLVERGGKVRSFKIDRAAYAEVERVIRKNVAKDARLMTDSAGYYKFRPFDVADHQMVNHEIEYVRGDVHTNTLKSYYSVFKRGMKGTYQHCDEKHLHRYAAEFDFRHNNRVALGVDDVARTEAIVRGIVGKRLTYR